jgi:molybdenum cofactor biosynthesis enzyme MoaA
MNKDKFCILPFMHLSTKTNGAMQLCCHANSSTASDYRQPGNNRKDNGDYVYVDKDKPSDYWNTEYMKNIRKKFMNNEVPRECAVCYKEEASGYRSKRQWENEEWFDKIDVDDLLSKVQPDGTAPFNIKYVDMKLGNKCDLACLMCNPGDSSLWIPDHNKLQQMEIDPHIKKRTQWKKNNKLNWYKGDSVFWSDLHSKLETIENLYIIGGEPTINPEFQSFLEKCVESGHSDHINLRFNTNGYTTTKELDHLYTCFKTCLIHLSLDGFGAYHNLIRYPSTWETMLEKLDYWDNTADNIKITIDLTASILNVMHIPDFVKWKMNKNFKKINMDTMQDFIGIHFLHSPEFLSIQVLPSDMKEQVRQKFNELHQWVIDNSHKFKDFSSVEKSKDRLKRYKRFRALISHMDSKDRSSEWPRALEYLDAMDKIRGTSWKEVLKEYDR